MWMAIGIEAMEELIEKKKKYFSYVRISNKSYAWSIDTQKHMLEKLAKDKWIEGGIEFYQDIKSWWDEKTEREWFSKMISLLENDLKKNKGHPENRKYGWILFWKIDRLSRNPKDFTSLENLLNAWYKFISVTETIDNSYMWKMLFRILSAFAILESNKNSVRESVASIHGALQKKWTQRGVSAIYGYEKTKNNKAFSIIDDEAEIIKQIYIEFLTSYASNSLATSSVSLFTIYQEVAYVINKKFPKFFSDYKLKSKNKHLSIGNKDVKIIEDILKNTNALKYKWCIETTINIKDEIVQKYVKSLIVESHKWFEFGWIPKIWWHIDIVYYDSDLEIINATLYDDVQGVFTLEAQTKQLIQKTVEIELFPRPLIRSKNTNEKLNFSRKEKRTKKWEYNWNYTKKIIWESISVSELSIENALQSLHIFKKLCKLWTSSWNTKLEKKLLKLFKDRLNFYSSAAKQTFQAPINHYESMIALLDNKITELSSWATGAYKDPTKELKDTQNTYADYKKKLIAKQSELADYENEQKDILNTLQVLWDKNRYKTASRRVKNILYGFLIDNIDITLKKKVKQWNATQKKHWKKEIKFTFNKDLVKIIWWADDLIEVTRPL